ncbi:SAM-dependent methyltransferase [Methylocaldum szegediense]|uniref:Cyclopropane-fatty-acyl-phospholipid synthase n=1 Tax=Methylocaldum szegediense TaxID=73780 RepID=A0ABM9I5Z4_9GAMM|nr:cyclopropane-fatty-acyl-phospholipid synthase family protein [Methylocaldum szegediense]CAI8914097.1 cyclopropane-fatty-acyl-phospholipid synthase [Methylocaldum szegediense]
MPLKKMLYHTASGLLARRIQEGCLHLHMPGSPSRRFGNGEPEVHWNVQDVSVLRRLMLDPEFQLGETYVEGGWHTGSPETLPTFLEVIMRNFSTPERAIYGRIRRCLHALIRQGNAIARSYRNVKHHYDLDEWLFRRFLDERLFYSCAYFEEPEQSLEQAQLAKCRLIARKLCLEPGMRVLDIGSGWGGLAIYLAKQAGVDVTGITLSQEQLRVAQAEAERAGLQDRVRFRLEDYRKHTGLYDRIVSVGMFEHVGLRHYPAFFRQLANLLKPDGVALLHTIGVSHRSGPANPWITRYIFPGSYIPLLSDLSPAMQRAQLMLTDLEVLRLHYAYTLREWFRRFQNHRAEVVDRMGERFARMWEFYLAVCDASFRWRDMVVFQLQLAKRHGPVPVTRNYLIAS